jgi:hypothetical protein
MVVRMVVMMVLSMDEGRATNVMIMVIMVMIVMMST